MKIRVHSYRLSILLLFLSTSTGLISSQTGCVNCPPYEQGTGMLNAPDNPIQVIIDNNASDGSIAAINSDGQINAVETAI